MFNNPLINKSKLAFYDPISHIIQVDFMNRDKWVNTKPSENILEIIQDERYEILYHEVRHLQDFTSSLWGINFQLKKYDCFANSLLYPNHSCEIVQNFFTYYNQIGENDCLYINKEYKYDSQSSWNTSIELHTENGVKYVKLIIQDSLLGKVLEQRVSIVSLLESNAIAEELMLFGLYNRFIKDKAFSAIENRIFFDKMVRLFHSLDFLEYSIVSHIISHHLPKYDLVRCALAGSIISNLCLNLDEYLINKIPIAEKFINQGVVKEDMYNNYGLLLYVIFSNYLDFYSDSKKNITIGDLLKANSLPSENELLSYVLNKVSNIQKSIPKDKEFSGLLMNDLETGKIFLKKRKISGMQEPLQKTIGENQVIINRFMFGDDFWDIELSSLKCKNMIEMNTGELWSIMDAMKSNISLIVKECG